jgi:hypothetical protein
VAWAGSPRVKPIPPLPPGPPPLGILPDAVRAAAIDARALPLGVRMERVSRPFLGKPYALGPDGEGEGIDPRPPVRYDAFDCLTLVEETLALALAGDPDHASAIRNSLRYGDSVPSYETRHHFMELQWIPAAIHNGWLVDTTARYGHTVRQETDVTTTTWKHWRKRSMFKLGDDQLPTGKISMDVLPLDDAIAAIDRFPVGALVLTVRSARGVPIWTTHIGFVVPGREPMMRNASRRTAMRVVDEKLGWYFEHLKSYEHWTVSGIAVLEPVEQDPRLAILENVASAQQTGDTP